MFHHDVNAGDLHLSDVTKDIQETELDGTRWSRQIYCDFMLFDIIWHIILEA